MADSFVGGLIALFVATGILIRLPLVGVFLIALGAFVPFPPAVCQWVSTSPECKVTVGMDSEIPIGWCVYGVLVVVLIPLGMEQSRRRNELYNLVDSVSFYKAYHSNAINEAIHLCCIPTILWSAIGILSFSSPVFGAGGAATLDWSALFAFMYAQYYLKMMMPHSIPVAIASFGLVIAAWVTIHTLKPELNTLCWIHGVAWVLQFWGHGVHEKRAPALLTNLSQALLMAPLFVLLEALFSLGWAPAMRKQVLELSQARIRELDAARARAKQ